MGAYIAVAPVFDPETGATHMPGHRFELDDERAGALVAAGFAELAAGQPAQPVPVTETDAEPVGTDDGLDDEGKAPEDCDMTALYETMTNANLEEILASRGVAVPKKANKRTLISLLVEGDG